MKVYSEKSLKEFEFWAGARNFVSKLTDDELDTIETILMDCCPEGMDETAINDLFWFDSETIAEWLDTTEEEILAR